MSKQIGFNELFNKASFDQGVSELVTVLSKITEEIKQAETAGKGLAQALGTQLKKDIAALSASSKTLSKEIADITAKMDNFKATNVKITQTTKEYEKEVTRLTKELEKLKQAQEKATAETEKGTKAKTNMAKVSNTVAQSFLGIASGAAIMQRGIQVLREQIMLAIESTIEFEKIMKEVKAVSGATDDELKLLTANANKLGATTEKTAQQIAEAQKELAKLGFTTPEILLATAAIVDLSTATGEDLVKTAEVAASTIRAFGLDVTELQRVTDVMTKSFVISALDLEKFRESVKLIAPIAANANVNIETVTATVSKLADTGISGSLAGTALRNLLSSMADPTEKLVQYLGRYDETLKGGIKSSDDFTKALKVLKGANVDLEDAVQMVDVRARTAFFTLVEYADDVEGLALQFQYLDGETKEVAKSIRDQLDNDIKIATSSFDSLRRNLVEGYIPAMRESVQATTTLSEAMRLFNAGVIFHDSVLIKLLGKYVDWLKMVHPLSVSLNIAREALGLFGIEFGTLEEIVAEGKATETFASIKTNVDAMEVSFGKFDQTLKDHEKVTELVNQGNKASEKAINDLRIAYPDLSSKVKDNTHFLKLLQMETKTSLLATQGNITALKDQERILTELITATQEQIKENGESESTTNTLTKANVELTRIQTIRLAQEAKMLDFGEKLKSLNKTHADSIDDLYEKQSKLINLRNQLSVVYAQNREENTRSTLAEQEEFLMKLNILDLYKQDRIKTQKAILKGELDSIKYSKDSEEEKNIKIQIAYAKHKQTLLNIERDYLKQREDLQENGLNNFAKTLSKEVKEKADQIKDKKENEKGLSDWIKDASKETYEFTREQLKQDSDLQWKAYTEDEQKRIKAEEEKRQQRIEAAQQLAQGLSDITRSIFDNQQLARENEMNAIDAWEQERIKMAGDNEEAIAAIEKEAEERRKKVRIEQAKADKKEAIFQILIRTAVGIMNALSALPPNPILAAVIGATGALQAATVAARPLPQFEKGTNYSPEGRAIVGEAGSELIIDGRTKQARLSPDRASITHLSKGSQVIPAHITQKLLTDPNFDYNGVAEKYLNKSTVIKVESDPIDYSRFGAEVREAIKEIPINQTNFDERGVTNYVVKRNVRLRRLNKRY